MVQKQKIIFLTSVAYFWIITCLGQSVVKDAVISDSRSNYLVVSFNQNITVSNADGFRLTGGAARIDKLIGGSGSNQLVFSLTDYVLPDDDFKLLYWPELGDAFADGLPLQGFKDLDVHNQTSTYHGKGQIFYVSTSGNDSFNGTSPKAPLRSIDKALDKVGPGDYILVKRSDHFQNTALEVNISGNEKKNIVISSYGEGHLPRIEHPYKNVLTINSQSYLHFNTLHIVVRGSGKSGIVLGGNSKNIVVSNCRIEGIGKTHYGINYGENDGLEYNITNPVIINNEVHGFRWNIRSSGYPYDGSHEVIGGVIENNVISGNRIVEDGDGISAQRGNFHMLIIRKNIIYKYYDDGIDLFAAKNVIVEHNTIHNPLMPSSSGQAIKAGGITKNEIINGVQSENIIIRSNFIFEILNDIDDKGSHNGIQTNNGASGVISDNTIYNVKGNGIVISGPISKWTVKNNLILNAKDAGIRVWTQGINDSNVLIQNNTVEGESSDISITTRSSKKSITGENNLLISNTQNGRYINKNDKPKIESKTKDLIVNDIVQQISNLKSNSSFKH